MDLVANPRNSPFASAVFFFFLFATESDPQPKKNSTPPTSRKSIFSRSFDHITANFGPITSSSKWLGPVASQGDPLAHRDLRRLQRTFQLKWTHKSYQRLIPLRNDNKKWWRSFTIIRMNSTPISDSIANSVTKVLSEEFFSCRKLRPERTWISMEPRGAHNVSCWGIHS